jgi:hypothetical protein
LIFSFFGNHRKKPSGDDVPAGIEPESAFIVLLLPDVQFLTIIEGYGKSGIMSINSVRFTNPCYGVILTYISYCLKSFTYIRSASVNRILPVHKGLVLPGNFI